MGISVESLKAAIALAEKATPGPYTRDAQNEWDDYCVWGPGEEQFLANVGTEGQGDSPKRCVVFDMTQANADFMVAVADPVTGYAAVCRELLERQTPVLINRRHLSVHSSRAATCECKARVLDGSERFCPDCGKPLLWEEKL